MWANLTLALIVERLEGGRELVLVAGIGRRAVSQRGGLGGRWGGGGGGGGGGCGGRGVALVGDQVLECVDGGRHDARGRLRRAAEQLERQHREHQMRQLRELRRVVRAHAEQLEQIDDEQRARNQCARMLEPPAHTHTHTHI